MALNHSGIHFPQALRSMLRPRADALKNSNGEDKRLLVVIGPARSMTDAAMDYANGYRGLREKYQHRLEIVM